MCISMETIKDKTSTIAKEYDIDSIYLFGSYARGDANDDSDIDMLIESNSMDYLAIARLRHDLADSLNANVDVVCKDSVSEVFRFLIKDDQVLIYEKS